MFCFLIFIKIPINYRYIIRFLFFLNNDWIYRRHISPHFRIRSQKMRQSQCFSYSFLCIFLKNIGIKCSVFSNSHLLLRSSEGFIYWSMYSIFIMHHRNVLYRKNFKCKLRIKYFLLFLEK